MTANARSALAEAFSFTARRFGQGVTPAEVVTVLQGIDGVMAVDLDRIWRIDSPRLAAPPQVILEATPPMHVDGKRQTAELLLISEDEADIILEPMAS